MAPVNTVYLALSSLLLLLLLLPGRFEAIPFAPTYIDWSSFTCSQLNEENTDQLDGCRFTDVSPGQEEVTCKIVDKERENDAIVTTYRKVMLITDKFRLLGNMPDQQDNVYCASLESMNMEIRSDIIDEIHTVGDLGQNFINFLYFVKDGSYIRLEFTKKIPSAIVTVHPDCNDAASKKRGGTHCVKSVRFMKEIKRGTFHLKFPSDEFWIFFKRRFISELGGEMTRMKLTSSGQLSAISVEFLTELLSSDVHMKELTLGSMKLGSLHGPVVTMPTLEILRLPDDEIITISEATLLAVPNILQLDVTGNQLQELPQRLPDRLLALNVSRNRLVSLPTELPQTLTNLNISYNAIEELQETLPAALLILDASHNSLQKLPQSLPTDLHRLDVSHNRLQMLHTDMPPNLEILQVAHNQLTTLEPKLLAPLKHLQVLDVSHNALTAVDGVWLYHQLPLLDVSHNIIRHVSLLGPGNVSHIDASENDIESWEVNADRLSLEGNPRAALGLQKDSTTSRVAVVDLGKSMPLNCDPCTAQSAVALQLRRWLLRQQNNDSLDGPRVERPTEPLCTGPQEHAGHALLLESALEDSSNCPGSPRNVALYLLLAVTVLALLGGIGAFCHFRRYEITYVIHLMKMRRERMAAERRNPASYKYDAFVCYSSADRHWVVGELLQKLEHAGDSPEEPALRLCLHERDFPLGSLIADNIVSSMRNSRSTVIVLSQAFVDSQWCRWELELASVKVSHLVLLELTRLDRACLPRHLRYLMDTRTYLEWPQQPKQQAVMWRRLRSALATPAVTAAGAEEGEAGTTDANEQGSRTAVQA
ncbi:toll-like receptor 2 isoform X1 [Schistocerca serialis cubense]|uniref:toll-like receptor 2 isoform X1 n=1 Tax=Schistocerca serialis cubense TaxID=2023355 RepID=UPI00214EA8A2|nr:toll-like receptor 2 isoform X1 [Schistocerca serialis cubense]